VYHAYERRLLRVVQAGETPRHVGIILDGNRRYGRRHNLLGSQEIYTVGANKLDELLDWCVELGIPAVTLWVLSTDNFARNAEDVSGILAALEAKIRQLIETPAIHRRGIRVRAVGRLDMLPVSTVAVLHAAEAVTKSYDSMSLTIAAAYGGRQEITDAVKALLRQYAEQGTSLPAMIEQVTPEAIGGYLYAPDLPDPDLIIRTSGEIRLSGFMLWQSASAELYFSDVYWPAFRKIDLLRAIRSFQGRQRRFGL
jgi:short-chain Z-isoprenyl diphosphate synthase